MLKNNSYWRRVLQGSVGLDLRNKSRKDEACIKIHSRNLEGDPSGGWEDDIKM
jgi:hypothetical protein